MQTIQIGGSSLKSSRLAYGCWRVAGTWNPEEVMPEREAAGRRAILTAYEAGYTLFDHADIYCMGAGEKIFGQVLKEVSGMRERVVIASKCGIRKKGDSTPAAPYRYDFTAPYILQSCEASLKRLGVEVIDLYQLHRPDYLCDPAEVAEAFSKLKQQGKVREFGVSNFRPSQVVMLQKACPMRLLVNQVEISLARLNCFEDGTLDQCLAETMTPLAWSPLAGGQLADVMPIDLRAEDHAKRIGLREELEHLARERGTTRTIVALAWLMKHPSGIVPIVGSTKGERIKEAVEAVDFELSREEWYLLLEASRGERLP
ncbi:MAG: aldo/keto reductase [Verrucomicrobia bacterium]|nr:aldo/keto reductase [Verrucomicrobiota bacterium]